MDRGKHISFEDAQSVSPSASDEDTSAVEVLFDPSNPYRRKSSLVNSETVPPHLRRGAQQQQQRTQQQQPNKSECLVHKLLESQKWIGRIHHHHRHGSTSQVRDISGSRGLDRVLDPKGARAQSPPRSPRRAILDGAMDSSGETSDDVGQFDEKAWKAQITRTESQMELEAAAAGGASVPVVGVDETRSRLLTKKQLSEMAWGVRELSRRLGSVRLRFRVKTIFLLTKAYDDDLIPKTREVARWLLSKDRDVRYTVYVDRNLKDDKRFDAEGLVEEVNKEDPANANGGGSNQDGGPSEIRIGTTTTTTSKTTEDDDARKRLRYWDEGMCRARPHMFDFVITLGGDGTVLYASWLFQRIVPPVLSFALGSLGFLTKFDFDEYQRTLTGAFREGVTVSLRLRFEGTVMRSQKRKKKRLSGLGIGTLEITDGGDNGNGGGGEEEQQQQEDDNDGQERKRDLIEELIGEEKDDEHTHRPDGTYEVLNEVVVDRGPNPTMSFTEIFGDDEHFTSILADGVCVCTPTGSTAYNLAAGGSLCHPENPVMLVTAICAHTLSFRPIILPDTIVLRIGVPYDARTSSWASFDGRERIELRPGDYVTISASRYPFASVQAPGRRSEDWINSISAKLGWNTRQRQKPFKEGQTTRHG
ncbi:ATP NAD kinase [Apodospora peruviana]|uniref:ATP NAD kinase n=1 Tax=Apodospora peruviana TaxID=516989 RepID=A0AAE0IIC9_9PEZI|nr:ATP NAD kinase [Apodospora peruviana]